MEIVNRTKLGEVFQLHTKEVVLVCCVCSEEFEYFTEFVLHAQEHLQQLSIESSTVHDKTNKSDCFQTEILKGNSTNPQKTISDETQKEIVENAVEDVICTGMKFWSEDPLKQEPLDDTAESVDQIPAKKQKTAVSKINEQDISIVITPSLRVKDESFESDVDSINSEDEDNPQHILFMTNKIQIPRSLWKKDAKSKWGQSFFDLFEDSSHFVGMSPAHLIK